MLVKLAGIVVEENKGNAHGVALMDGVVDKMGIVPIGYQLHNQMVVMEHLVVKINIDVF
jgi:hypothetical protein